MKPEASQTSSDKVGVCETYRTSSAVPNGANIGKSHPEQILMAGGKAASTKVPALHLIPTDALVNLAFRFELGIERKGDKAWNALSKNQEILLDREFLIERISHIIHHALKLRDKLLKNDIAGMEEDDDAGAVTWGGVFLLSAVEAIKKDKELQDEINRNF